MTVEWGHPRERFFKYTSASTAIKILERSAVRYSSPLIFNDPFDIQSGLHFPFDVGPFPHRVLQRMKDLVVASTRPQVDEEDDFGKAIILMWENRGKREMPEAFLVAMLDSLRDRLVMYQDDCQKLWNELLPRMRVFSVTEDPDNILMWSHYALNHAGVVFAFRVMVEEDNALCAARPVIYRREPPSLLSEEDWIEFMLGTRLVDPNKELFQDYANIKSDIWAYEKEWRVWLWEPGSSRGLFGDFQLLPEEVEAVYFGCKIDPRDKEVIGGLLSAKYPQAKMCQARKPISEYKIYFDEV